MSSLNAWLGSNLWFGISTQWWERIVPASLGGLTAAILVWICLKVFRPKRPEVSLWAWRFVLLKFVVGFFWVTPVVVDAPNALSKILARGDSEGTSLSPGRGDAVMKPLAGASIPDHPKPMPFLYVTEVGGKPQFEDRGEVAYSKDEMEDYEAALAKSVAEKAGVTERATALSLSFAVWMIGLFFVGFACFLQLRRLRRKREVFDLVTEPSVLSLYEKISLEMGVSKRRPDLVSDEEAESPHLIGFRRPIIVLPKKMLDQTTAGYSEEEIGFILAHELAHFSLGHLRFAWFTAFASAIYFFHPVLWFVRREIHFNQEWEADELALRICIRVFPNRTAAIQKRYAATLLKVIREPRRTLSDGFAVLSVVESYQTLKRRILSMQFSQIHDQRTPPSLRKKWIYTSTLALLGLFGMIPFQFRAEAAGPNAFSSKCPDIDKCIKAVSDMTGDKYIYDPETIKGKVTATDNMDLTKENATLLLTKSLAFNGFTRVPIGAANTYQIIKDRDARDTLLPKVTASLDQAPDLPDNWDLYQMKYQAKHPEVVDMIARNVRSFMPASSRIIPIEISGQVLVTATAPDLKNVYEIMRDIDRKPSKELVAAWKRQASGQASGKRDAKNGPGKEPGEPPQFTPGQGMKKGTPE